MQSQSLTDTFVEAVRYIYYNRRHLERVEINKHLLSLGLDPFEIDQAWQAIQAKQGWAILQEARKPVAKRRYPDNRPYESLPSKILSRFISFVIVFIFFLFGWGIVAGTQGLENGLTILIGFSSAIFNSFLLISTWQKWKLNWIGGLLIGVQFLVIIFVIAGNSVNPGPPTPFTPYPNATRLTLPAEDTIKDFHGFVFSCYTGEHSAREVYAANTSSQAISEYYANQAKTIGLKAITADNFYGIRPINDASCYVGRNFMHAVPANGVAYMAIPLNPKEVAKLFPTLPPDATYLIFVFNGVLSTI